MTGTASCGGEKLELFRAISLRSCRSLCPPGPAPRSDQATFRPSSGPIANIQDLPRLRGVPGVQGAAPETAGPERAARNWLLPHGCASRLGAHGAAGRAGRRRRGRASAGGVAPSAGPCTCEAVKKYLVYLLQANRAVAGLMIRRQ